MFGEWLHYALRLFHLIAGIMWIGTSFYFVWLDFSFEKLAEEKEGVEGETYMVHGGFFYRVEKQRPIVLPKTLHWFKYEALLTWVSGVFLLLLVYWTGGGLALVDYTRFAMHPHAAMAVSAGTLIVGWAVYDLLWKLVGPRAPKVALFASLALLLAAIYGLCAIFPGRAAFIHVGAMLGTIMVANVWMRILPAQRRMIAARIAGQEPNWAEGAAAKHRSLHNSYVTIPVLVTMISNHFSAAFDHPQNWVLLSILCVVGASVRHLMITVERKQTAWWAFAPALGGMIGLVALTMPAERPVDTGPPVAFAEANDIITRRCRSCHSATPTDDVFHTAPNGVTFDTPASVQAYAPRMRLRAVEARTMPLANKTEMTEDERETLRRWIDQGARLQ
ncbi:MAG: urate hydroxylase PuuD [Myxococcota bacterium]|nr:urate hydroxylase PuuD [Myxococcota bacterium]